MTATSQATTGPTTFPVESDGDGVNVNKSGHPRQLTRMELKQLDREIPWGQLLKLPKEQLELYVESAVKEAKSWFQWESVEPLTAEQVKEVMASPKLRKRILRSRAVFRDKARGQGPLRPKCRVVCLGHLDPTSRP